jgi:hypothetical protein
MIGIKPHHLDTAINHLKQPKSASRWRFYQDFDLRFFGGQHIKAFDDNIVDLDALRHQVFCLKLTTRHQFHH